MNSHRFTLILLLIFFRTRLILAGMAGYAYTLSLELQQLSSGYHTCSKPVVSGKTL